MLLSIISGTYNRLPYLKAMVESARKSMPPRLEHEFVIADGGSTDGTLEWMREQADIRVLEQGKLLGAIAAFNAAGAAAKGDYLLVANDDIEFLEFSIARGLAHMLENPDIGAGCFFQDRSGKEFHVERMPIYYPGEPDPRWEPYMQVGIIPRWLWDKCGGWGDWGGYTYGGDNYLSARVYESGYRVVPLEGCKISDKTPKDALRDHNNDSRRPDQNLWKTFPEGFKMATTPIYPNPLKERKRVLYAPIIEAGHTIQKEQKKGLREALSALGVVWEVDYVYSKESVADAAEAWQPHYIITQFHAADAISMNDVKRIRDACNGFMINWSGDVWADQASPKLLEMLRYYDYHLTVNAALLPRYEAVGVRAAYWQNSAEPPVSEKDIVGPTSTVIFLGNNYQVEGAIQSRAQLVTMLTSLPYKVAIYGRGYPEGIAEGESLYDFRKTGALYRGARLAIADNQFLEADGFFSDRAFMILAAGGCMLLHQKVQRMEELAGLKNGVHYVEWEDLKDLRQKIAYYTVNENKRAAIAAAGHAEYLARHTFDARVQELKSLLERIPKKKPTIAALLIVKNEAENLKALLPQLDFADEVVIVDTGSTDGTLQAITEVFPEGEYIFSTHPEGAVVAGEDRIYDAGRVKVYRFEWVEDFSAARNFAKSKCQSDWIFWVDADDRIPEDTRRRLQNFENWSFRSLGVNKPGAFKMKCVEYREGKRVQTALQTRLFKNLATVQWRGRVHENVDPSLGEIGIVIVGMQKVEIHHQGASDKAIQRAKQERNLALLDREEDSAWRDFHKGLSYGAMERWADAALWFEEALGKNPDAEFEGYLHYVRGQAYAQLGLFARAKESLVQSAYPDAWYLLDTLDKEPEPERLRRYLKAPRWALFPSSMDEWKPLAKQKLLEWHRKELEQLVAG